MARLADHPAAAWVLAAVALGVAAAGAKPYAGSWNDGSRLAAVESLLDRGTLAIDDSIFCKPPQRLTDAGTPPYPPDRPDLLAAGTLDKLFVRGRFHSDKPAVVSVLMAAAYRPLMGLGVPSPADRPDIFCWTMTVLTSGLGYAAAVGCLWVIGRRVGLSLGWRLAWLAGFAVCTFAPAYTRHVNNHAMQLGVVAGLCVLLVRIADSGRPERLTAYWGRPITPTSPPPCGGEVAAERSGAAGEGADLRRAIDFPPSPGGGAPPTSPPHGGGEVGAAGHLLNRRIPTEQSRDTPYAEGIGAPGVPATSRTPWALLLALGTLAGLGFNLDFGSGPPLVAAVFAVLLWRARRVGPVLVFALAVLPWVAAGVGINYAVGGVWKPLNMYPEHFRFPGTPFTEQNLTGFLRHRPLDQLLYAGGMLFGKHGFWNHNLPLLLAAAAGWRAMRHPFPGRPELLALLGWCTATWLMYGVLSNNMGGGCCSVRWFVPFLAPGFWWLALLLHARPEFRTDFVALCGWGGVLAGLMWWKGPWTLRMVPLMWPVVGSALLTWGIVVWRRWRITARSGGTITVPADEPVRVERRAA